jgi:uncharacterized protein (TIGR03067 family)
VTQTLRLFAAVALFGLFAVTVSARDDKTAAGTTKLDGQYTVESGERDGKAMSDLDVKGCKVVIAGDKITGTDGGGKEFLRGTFKVDETKKPMAVTLKAADGDAKTYSGLCEKTADGLKIVYNMDGGEAPTEFKTKDKQVLLVLKQTKG